jgi:hypothetical protein
MTYAEWLVAYAAKHPHARGLCLIACAAMRAVFPELIETRGWANGSEHVWLVDEAGAILDPTAHQFEPPINYRPFKPGDTVRVGRCMECGDTIFAEVDRLDDPKYARSLCPECQGDGRVFGHGPYDEAVELTANDVLSKTST